MIDLFVRWLARQRHETAWQHGRRRRQSIKLQQQVEPLEMRLVLSEVDPPVLTTSSSEPGHRVTIYSDLTGDGFTSDDVAVPFTIQVFKQRVYRDVYGVVLDGASVGDPEEAGVYGTFEMPNGGLLDATHTITYWQDRNLNGQLDPWGGDPSIKPEMGYFKATSEFVGMGAGGEPTANFPAGQEWILSDSQYDASGNLSVAYVRRYSVRGSVYEDLNANGLRDAGEPGIQTGVFSDWNRNGIWDEPDRSFTERITREVADANAFTNLNGTFEAKIFGTGKIGVGFPDGQVLTTIQGLGQYSAPDFSPPDGLLNNMEFGVFQKGKVQGRVFNDSDGDGVWHPARGEEALPGILITVKQGVKTYLTVSGDDGYFSVYVGPGDYEVSQDLSQLGIRQTVPADPHGYSGTFTESGQVSELYQFGRVEGKDVAISAATRADQKGVDYTWQSADITSSFDVGLYRSADMIWDSSDVQLIALQTFTPGSGVKTGSGRFEFNSDYEHDPNHPYLIAVADPIKHIGETSETNNALVVRRIIDLSPFQVTGGFTYDAPNDQFVSDGPARVGFKPATPDEAFVPLVGGNITFDADRIKVAGLVTTDYGDSPVGLLEGNVTLNVHSGGVADLNVVSGVWQIAGCQFAFDAFNLVNPDGGSALDSYLNVQGTLITPDATGAFRVQFAEPNFIHFGPKVHGISATISLADSTVLLGDLLTMQASGASISYLATTEANPTGAFRIQGKFVVKNPGLTSYDDAKASLEITGPNFIEFGSNGLYFVGQFGAQYWTIIPGFLRLKSGTVFLDTIHHEWKGDGELEMLQLTDKTLQIGRAHV